MRETIRPSDRTRKRCSSNCSRGGSGFLEHVRPPLLALAVLVVASAALCAQEQPQDQATQQASEERGVPRTLTTESDLARLEDALAELLRKTEAVASAIEEAEVGQLRPRIESLRGELERWKEVLAGLSVNPAEDGAISRGRYRRFERRVSRTRERINSSVLRINERLQTASGPPEAEPAASEGGTSS